MMHVTQAHSAVGKKRTSLEAQMEFFLNSLMKLLLLAGRTLSTKTILSGFMLNSHYMSPTNNQFYLFGSPPQKKPGFQVCWIHANVQKFANHVTRTQFVSPVVVCAAEVFLEMESNSVQVSDFICFMCDCIIFHPVLEINWKNIYFKW